MKNKYFDLLKIRHIIELIEDHNFLAANEEIRDYKFYYPDDKLINLCNAKMLIFQKEYDEAEEICLDLLNDKIINKNAYYNVLFTLGNVYFYKNDLNKSFKIFKKYFDDKQDIKSLFKLFEIYKKREDYANAKNILKTYKKNDDNHNILINIKLAEIAYLEKDYKRILNLLLNSDDRNIYNKTYKQERNFLIAKAYYCLGNYDEALDYAKKVLIIKNESYYLACTLIAKIKYCRGQINDAIDILESTIKYLNNDLNTCFLIKLYILKGRISDANNLLSNISEENRLYYTGLIKEFEKKYDEASQYFEKSINYNSNCYNSNDVIYNNIVCNFKLEKYKEVLDTIENLNLNDFTNFQRNDLLRVKIYCQHKLNIEILEKTYLVEQINDYSEEKALEHIISNHVNSYKKSNFYEDIDIYELFEYVKNNLIEDRMVHNNAFDTYYIDYNKAGYNNDVFYNQIVVICLPNTKKILTMYSKLSDELVFDSEEKNQNNKFKVKRLSQIEKFNKKYDLNNVN